MAAAEVGPRLGVEGAHRQPLVEERREGGGGGGRREERRRRRRRRGELGMRCLAECHARKGKKKQLNEKKVHGCWDLHGRGEKGVSKIIIGVAS